MKRVWIGLILLTGFFGLASAEGSKSAALNTAAGASYLSPLEKEVIYEINLFRSNPSQYAERYIAPLAKYYDKKILHYPGDRAIKTTEGQQALTECINFLRKASPKPILYPDKNLSRAARSHQLDQQKTGKTGHLSNNGTSMRNRVQSFGKWKVGIGENIAYGNTSARQIVIFLLIDDGVSNRGHRKMLLQPEMTLAGVACGKHPVYETMCVMDFAGGSAEKE